MTEQAVLFGATGSLVGIVTEPSGAERRPDLPAFVFLNAGVTHRVGPNRLSVRLARELAADGFTSLRFDYSGLGDSAARTDNLTADKSVVLETREAMDHLQQAHGIDRFILLGICSGAANSYVTAQADPRVVGAVLINGQAHLHGPDLALTDHLRARTLSHHGWRIALRSSYRSKNWRKVLAGQLNPLRILRMLFSGARTQQELALPDVLSELRVLTGRGVRVFHLYCEGDEGLDYFHVVLGDAVREVATDDNSRFEIVAGSNHMFTLQWSQDRLAELVRAWAQPFRSRA
jgi:pimeloyl-ACP methyl ester carboxylesterase